MSAGDEHEWTPYMREIVQPDGGSILEFTELGLATFTDEQQVEIVTRVQAGVDFLAVVSPEDWSPEAHEAGRAIDALGGPRPREL